MSSFTSFSNRSVFGPTPELHQRRPNLRDYLRLARFDHVVKHVFILPGLALAWLLRGVVPDALIANLVYGFGAAIAIASANYVINEWLDREFDAYHPEKSQRAAVQTALDPRIVYGFYAALLVLGLALAARVNTTFLLVIVIFAMAGVIYNVAPLRTKDRIFIDVLSESFNNPLRLALGWSMIDPDTLPPASLLLGFWLGGAFLMNSKRLAEYRDIVAGRGRETLELYRPSFAHYTEASLSVANLVYALLCGFFLAIFVVKYRIEYVLLFPVITAVFGEYYALTLRPNSVARAPEKLFRAGRLMALSLATVVVFLVATLIDIPLLEQLAEQHFIDFAGRVVGPK